MFWSIAYAQAGAPAQPGILEQVIIPFGFVFLIFYFLIIRPQGKRQKQHLEFVGGLKRGDEVLTASGIFGRIEGITEKFVTLEISEGVRIKLLKTQIAGPVTTEGLK